jgi:hypothetical protein
VGEGSQTSHASSRKNTHFGRMSHAFMALNGINCLR